MKKLIINAMMVMTIWITACESRENPGHENTGNGAMDSPTKGIPPGEPDSVAKDNTRVTLDTIHK